MPHHVTLLHPLQPFARALRALLLSICLVAVASCGGGGGGVGGGVGNAPAEANAAPAMSQSADVPLRCTVEVYGDSIMANNSTPERPLATRQREDPNQTFNDHSVPGTLLVGLARTFDKLPRTGRWVVIQNGVIDAWHGIDPMLFTQTLRGMIERVRSEGREPMLTGFSRQVETPRLDIHPAQLARRDWYDGLTRQVAVDMQVPFVDWGAVRFDGPNDLQDGVHPNLDYSNRLFDKLLETLYRVSDCR